MEHLFLALALGGIGGWLAARVYYWQLVNTVHALETISRRTYAVEAKRAQRAKVEEILRVPTEGRQPPGLAHPAWQRANVDPLAIPTRES